MGLCSYGEDMGKMGGGGVSAGYTAVKQPNAVKRYPDSTNRSTHQGEERKNTNNIMSCQPHLLLD